MKNSLKRALATCLTLLWGFSFSLTGFAAEIQSNPGNDETIIYKAEEMTEPEDVISAALQGKDDLLDNHGIQVSSEITTSNECGDINTYFATQLLERKNNGSVTTEKYAISLLAVSGQLYYDMSDSGDGCSLMSRMYIQCREYNGKQQIKLLYTTASVTGSSTLLSMKNAVRLSAVNDPIYTSSGTASPSGNYTLYPTSSAAGLWIEDSTGIASLENMIYTSAGGSVSTRFSVNPLFIQSAY